MELSEYEVAEDMQIDGLKIVQDTRLYRFTSDSVLLSRFARAKTGDEVADFCAGSGIVQSRRANASVPVRRLHDPQRVFMSRTAILGIAPPGQVAANCG